MKKKLGCVKISWEENETTLTTSRVTLPGLKLPLKPSLEISRELRNALPSLQQRRQWGKFCDEGVRRANIKAGFIPLTLRGLQS